MGVVLGRFWRILGYLALAQARSLYGLELTNGCLEGAVIFITQVAAETKDVLNYVGQLFEVRLELTRGKYAAASAGLREAPGGIEELEGIFIFHELGQLPQV